MLIITAYNYICMEYTCRIYYYLGIGVYAYKGRFDFENPWIK